MSDSFIQPKLTGYRQLTDADAALMNRIKALGAEIRQLERDIGAHLANEALKATDEQAALQFHQADPSRWLRRGAEDASVALMLMTRAVARPTHF